MGLETSAYIKDLVLSNPAGSDLRQQGDNHFRNLKTAVQQTYELLGTFTTAGAAPAFTVTTSHVNTPSLIDGGLYGVWLHASLAADSTLNVDGLGAKNIQKLTASGWVNVAVNDFLSGDFLLVVYNSSAGKFRIINSPFDAAYLTRANTFSGANIFTATQTFKSSDAGAGAGPDITLWRESASPATSDALGRINFDGMDSGAAQQTYAQILAYINDPTAASEDGGIAFLTAVAGTIAARMVLDTSLEMSVSIDELQSSNIASAATVNIGAAVGNYIHITGTTTITAFDTIQAGVERVLVFDGALTLTHNATSLILPAAKNITTVAGDCALFRSEGSGNWRCIAYFCRSGNGTYSPTATSVSNLDSTPNVAYTHSWYVINNQVHVWGRCDIDPTAGGLTITKWRLSLPIASNFTDIGDCIGSVRGHTGNKEEGNITADTTNDEALFELFASVTSTHGVSYNFDYRIA